MHTSHLQSTIFVRLSLNRKHCTVHSSHPCSRFAYELYDIINDAAARNASPTVACKSGDIVLVKESDGIFRALVLALLDNGLVKVGDEIETYRPKRTFVRPIDTWQTDRQRQSKESLMREGEGESLPLKKDSDYYYFLTFVLSAGRFIINMRTFF